MEAQDYIQVVALVAHFGNVEVDSAAVVVAAATRIAGITIGIADGYAAVAGVVGFGFHYFVVAQLVVGIFIFEAKIAVAAYLGPFHPYPDAFFVFAFMAQVAQPLHQLVVVEPGVVGQRAYRNSTVHAGGGLFFRVNVGDGFQIPIGSVVRVVGIGFLVKFVALVVQGTFAVYGGKGAVVVFNAGQHGVFRFGAGIQAG